MSLSLPEQLSMTRAFTYLSHLLNIVEDVEEAKNARASGGPAPRGSVAHALERLSGAGVPATEVAASFARIAVAPVLTAHPTEVQRRSILESEMEITRMLRRWASGTGGGGATLTPAEEDELDGRLRRLCLSLWQTAMLRLQKLTVSDEVNNGLEHFRRSFIPVVPSLYASLERHLAHAVAAGGSSSRDATATSAGAPVVASSNNASSGGSDTPVESSPVPDAPGAETPLALPLSPSAPALGAADAAAAVARVTGGAGLGSPGMPLPGASTPGGGGDGSGMAPSISVSSFLSEASHHGGSGGGIQLGVALGPYSAAAGSGGAPSPIGRRNQRAGGRRRARSAAGASGQQQQPPPLALPPFLRVGSWVGADRDGHPGVTAGVLSYAVTRQAGLILEHYLSEVQALHKEIAISTRLVTPTPALLALAAASGITGAAPADEPYRTALKGMYARLYETAHTIVGGAQPTAVVAAGSAYAVAGEAVARAPHVRGLPAYATAQDFAADLGVIKASLASHKAGELAVDRLDPLIRAVSIFGFQ
jgi:phosphoenolpyruvate carboxylase